ncbi:MAG: nitrogenase component 1 [Spirochaetales bacterium]|nr:nitrogenase component 1 [Spirochaetales bacterium]
MKHSARIIPIYAADTSGVCSALYELGGMTVVHDASGCNSTYTTHDEPRWYDIDSMVYISALTETEAIMGDDAKLVSDITETASKLSPKFIALCGAPVAMMIGTDYQALAIEIEENTGIPSFCIQTNGMHSYLKGASEAFEAIINRFCKEDNMPQKKDSVNILGATPLDFSVNGSIKSIKQWLYTEGFSTVSCMGMGSSLEDIKNAAGASVNLVISYSGLSAAKLLKKRFGTPYVTGVPFGQKFAGVLADKLRTASKNKENLFPSSERFTNGSNLSIVGESIYSGSLARAIELEYGKTARVLCPLETSTELQAESDGEIPDEESAEKELALASGIIADPLYKPICPNDVPFYRLPHEAFSGRCYRSEIPNMIKESLKATVFRDI